MVERAAADNHFVDDADIAGPTPFSIVLGYGIMGGA
jgi:hypothetical protein